MKRFFAVLFLLLVSLAAKNYDFLHYHHNFKKALNQAIKEEKMVMLFQVQDYCPWCSQMAQTLIHPQIISEIKKNFIPILLNKNHDTIPEQYRSPLIPAIYFINPFEDEEVWRNVGFRTFKELLSSFKKAVKSFKEDLKECEELDI